jgi:formiminoglutamate deiminase
MTTYWCEMAVLDGQAVASVRITEWRGAITAVEEATGARDDDVVLAGLTLPGLANGHSHVFHRALRGTTHANGGTFWTWRTEMYRLANLLDPDSYLDLATAVFAEMVLAGYTVVGEFHYLHQQPDGTPYENPTAMEDAVVEAAARAGIRLTLLDTLYLDGGIGLPLEPAQRRFSDGSVEKWAARRDAVKFGATARRGSAIHSVRAVSPSLYVEVRDASRKLPLHAHVSEQSVENEAAINAYGKTPTELFAEAGLLALNFTAVHGTHLSEHDLSLLYDAESTVCFCPTTERDLADGIGPAAALQSGASLSLGSDQNAVIDPFEEIRGLEMNERLASRRRGNFTPIELIDSATSVGYKSLGWPNGGEITPGSLCDLVTIDMTSPRTAGVDPSQAWFAATSADVTTVIVDGVMRVRDGKHELGDIGELLATAIGKLYS